MDDVTNAVVDLACRDGGAGLTYALTGLFGLVAGASALANFRSKIPPGLVKLLDLLALNFIKGLHVPQEKK